MEVYLDNAATSYPKPECVVEAVARYMRDVGASAGRGTYRKALAADRIVYEARRSLAKLFGVKDPSRIVFTSNATESINLAIKGFARPGFRVVTTSMEHNAVWRCLKTLERRGVITLSQVRCHPDGTLDLSAMEEALSPGAELVVMVHASNVTGTLMPVSEVSKLARARGAALLVDAAQTAGVVPIDVEDLGVDLMAFTGHKGLLGPQGTGGLYIREGVDLLPLKEGGTGSESAREEQPESLPDRHEAGTLNAAGIAGLGAAADYLLEVGVENVRLKEKDLTSYALEELQSVPGVTVYGPKDPERQVGVISFNLADVRPEEVAYVLDEVYGVMVRAGLHCAPCAHKTIGTINRGTVRAGLGWFSEREHVDCLVAALREIAERV